MRHTIVFSDIHLTTAEPVDLKRPLWKRYKHRELYVDASMARMLVRLRDTLQGKQELVLNGDVFDFDAVDRLPEQPEFPVSWLERQRGLHPTEVKSAWKLAQILDDHPIFVQAMRDWLTSGHDLIFTIGNHDIELHWPAVQRELRDRLAVDDGGEVRLCEWFYVSNGDTLIEHGNQYDNYCLCIDPIHPTIRVPPAGDARIRLPFGNYAARYMVNGMGLINPHAESAWVMSFWGYVVFFYRDVARTQPLLAWTWAWTAMVTFWASLRDGLMPAETDVLTLEDRVDSIAERANATPRVVRGLRALRVHPAIFNPLQVARELWLDRLMLAVLVLVGSVQAVATLKLVFGISAWWWFAIFAFFLGPFLFYARSVHSDANNQERLLRRRVEVIHRLTEVPRIVLGHTHVERHTRLGPLEVLNPGTWSPAYMDAACTEPVGRKCIVRISPTEDGTREAFLEVWNDAGFERLPCTEAQPIAGLPRPGWFSDGLGETSSVV